MTSVSASIYQFFEQRFAHDKGKPAARQGRKAVNLSPTIGERLSGYRSSVGEDQTLPLSFGGRSLPTRECKVLTGTPHPRNSLLRVGSGASHIPLFRAASTGFAFYLHQSTVNRDRRSLGVSESFETLEIVHQFVDCDCALSLSATPDESCARSTVGSQSP